MIAPEVETHEVIIIGAGISGVNFAYRLQERVSSDLDYIILEGRDTVGGTWDLFKYPGIRSDSDLYTFSFAWNPWTGDKSIAEGGLIWEYIRDSAAKFGIDKHIRFRHHVSRAEWSSEEHAWTLRATVQGVEKTFRARYVLFGTGYYDYETPLQTTIPGIEDFGGKVIHPQFWPEDLDYSNKNVVIIGSGATAITLLPSIAEKAAHCTMLQRSPSYILSQPSEDKLEKLIRAVSPSFLAQRLVRVKWLLLPWLLNTICTYFPNAARNLITAATKKQLPPNLPYDPHFKPRYNPWEQRLCFCPNGDFYAALRSGKASIATDTIASVTKNSIKLASGQELHPDIIVTATGLKMRLAGGARISVDDEQAPLALNTKFMWKSVMLQDLPNAFFSIGYVNASWTLGADAAAYTVCRVINQAAKAGAAAVVPRAPEGVQMREIPVMNLRSTYIQKARDVVPKAADRKQWRPRKSYFSDMWEAMFGDVTSELEFLRG